MKYGTCFATCDAIAERKEDQCAILKYVLSNKEANNSNFEQKSGKIILIEGSRHI
jgi:hypothetical protein